MMCLLRNFQDFIQGRSLSELLLKGLKLVNREGLHGVKRLYSDLASASISYTEWIRRYDKLDKKNRQLIHQHISHLGYRPTISVLMPVYNPPADFLRKAIDSVRRQLYPNWELCIADDASTLPYVRTILEEAMHADGRIHVTFRANNGHISRASNTALQMATGEFVALLDHDDELAEHAFYLVAVALNENPKLDLLYSDEDKIDVRGRYCTPSFKPDWNPDLFMSQNLVGHLAVFRTACVLATNDFRPDFDGYLGWDLALRISEMIPATHIHHLPYVLYHSRIYKDEASMDKMDEEKSDALEGATDVIREHLARIAYPAIVDTTSTGVIRVRHQLPAPPPLVSIIIPTRNGEPLLRRCLDSLKEKTTYSPYEIIIVDNQSNEPETLAYLSSLSASNIARVIPYNAPFNYSAINNYASRFANGSFLCLLNNDIEIIDSDWLGEMVSQAARPEIGAVGALLYYPDDTIQHAGVIVGMSGCANHPYAGAPRGTTGMMGRASVVQNLSAVTAACLVIRKEIYDAAGGFDEVNLPVSFNDVDFCLRVMELGYRNLWTPFASMYHHESATRGPEDNAAKRLRAQREADYMRLRWPRFMTHDPAYNPNLSLNSKWPRQGANPRVKRPWLDFHI